MATTNELHCPQLVALVTEYLEGKLPKAEQQRIEQHLAQCGNCTNYLEQMRWTIRLLSMLPGEAISEQARERVLRAFRRWTREQAG